MIPVSILINRWFYQHRALALSICASGSGIATIVLPPVTTHLVERFSMSAAFRMEGAAILVCAGVVLLVLRNDPREKGLRPCGQTEIPPEAPATAVSPSQGALGRRTWILLGYASLFMGAVANPGFSHLSVLYTSEGFAPATVALMISGTGVMITVGKLLYGETTDRIGGRGSCLLFGGVLLAGHLLCCLAFVQSTALSVVNVLCLGLGYPIATMGPSVWSNDLAAPEQYPVVVRRLQVIYAGGALLFASLPGLLADRLGGYIPAYLLFSAIIASASSALLWPIGRGEGTGEIEKENVLRAVFRSEDVFLISGGSSILGGGAGPPPPPGAVPAGGCLAGRSKSGRRKVPTKKVREYSAVNIMATVQLTVLARWTTMA